MWTPRRGPERESLNRYWNALNRGAPPEELARLAAPLDPTLIAAIDRARSKRSWEAGASEGYGGAAANDSVTARSLCQPR